MSDHPPTAAAERRPLGNTSIRVSPVALGCWPIAGMTTIDVSDADSIATIRSALDQGVNFLDTAYGYGVSGESERLIARALDGRRDQAVIATKGGLHYNAAAKQHQQDARAETILRQCDESLQRLGTDRVELYYLHAFDPHVPVAESAGAIRRLIEAGKALAAGASNCSLDQLRAFHAECPLAAVQLPFNMLQQDIQTETVPWCVEHGVAVTAYWPLMKGLLAGRMAADHQLDERDSRRKYPMYQGQEWEKNQAFVARLREIADRIGQTVAQLVVNWTIHQPGITAALCGAKRAWQIEETAGGMGWRLAPDDEVAVEAAIRARGKAEAKRLYQ